MKLHLFTLIATLAIPVVSSAYDIVVGTNQFDVVFEDVATPLPLQDFIVEDIQRCYNAWGTNVVFRPSLPVRHGSYIRVDVFGGPYWHDRRSVDVPDSIVTNATGQLSLMVPSIVIQKYAEASEFKSNHLEQVLATDAFVDFLSSPEFANVPSNEVSNYILYKNMPPADYVLNGEDILQSLMKQEFYRPSILGFYYFTNGPAPTNLCVLLPTILKKRKTSPSFNAMPAIWHDGKWKINMWGWE